MAEALKILVAGMPKSGTTWLFFRLRNSLPPETRTFFETASGISDLQNSKTPVLAKLLIGPLKPEAFGDFQNFERKIFIYRDFRDWLISNLLYTAAYHRLRKKPLSYIQDFLRLLEQKETHPKKIPFHVLFCHGLDRTLDEYRLSIQENCRKGTFFCALYPDYFKLRYEDLVHEKRSFLESYLGFSIAPASVPLKYQRVVRTKGCGSWRKWLTEEDTAFLKPLLTETLDFFGYDSRDWTLDPDPLITPGEASGYVRRVLADNTNVVPPASLFQA